MQVCAKFSLFKSSELGQWILFFFQKHNYRQTDNIFTPNFWSIYWFSQKIFLMAILIKSTTSKCHMCFKPETYKGQAQWTKWPLRVRLLKAKSMTKRYFDKILTHNIFQLDTGYSLSVCLQHRILHKKQIDLYAIKLWNFSKATKSCPLQFLMAYFDSGWLHSSYLKFLLCN